MPTQNPPAGTSNRKLIPVWRADWLRLVGGAVLAAGAIAVYSRTFSVPLLFDDSSAIADNLTIRHWSTAFWPPLNTTASGRPILNLSLAVNYAISGTAVWSYHALNLAIHVLAGLTLFGIVRRTLARRADPAAFLVAFSAALLWTLHPLQTESVTYIIQRAESLMGLFYLLTLYCFIRSAEADGRPRRLWSALCVAACLLGMATKEVMVTAPLIVLLYDRTFLAGSFREAWRRRWGLHVGLAATWLLLGGLVASTGWDRSGTSGFDVGITPWAYWLTQFEAVTRYLWLSVWPHPLVLEYGAFWVNRPAEVALYALVVMVLAVAVLVALWRRPALGFPGAWFFAILAPTSVMPGRIQMIVEHRMYLPLAAVMTLAAIGIHAAVRRQSWVVFAAVALALGLLTARRNEDYRSRLSIWSDTVARRPDNERAHYNLGNAWAEIPGRLNDAIAEYGAALRLKPDYAEAHNNLGVALAKMPGRLNDAIAEYEAALRLQPDSADAHNNLGNAWSRVPGRLNDAVAEYEAALRLQPGFVQAHSNLGGAFAQMPERSNDAIAQYEAALRLKPDYAEAHINLGVVFAQMPGRLNDAIAQYEEALRLKPDSAEAHNNLGLAFAKMPGRLNDAIAQYEEALRLQPDYAPGWHNLGAAWFHLGNLPAAAAAFREELRLAPADPAARQALATVLRQAGDH
jgi:tetratricopeptide (TPR) repeat protein